MRRQAAFALAILAGLCLLGTARAATAGPIDRRIQDLFWTITAFVVLVAVIVYGSMVWFLIRYRRSVAPEPTSHSEGSKRIEIIWSVFPTIILIIITLISVPVLYYTDTPPRADTTVTVTGQQFSWTFTYEDGTKTTGHLWIQEDIVVYLRVTSIDVVHSFAVPQLGVKIDAIPGKINPWWMTADTPGDYLNQCAEFCGIGHYDMRATVHVFRAGSQPRIFGPPPTPLSFTDMELREFNTNGTSPWSIVPSTLTRAFGSQVSLRIWNNNTSPRDFRIDAPVNESVPPIGPFAYAWLNFTLNATSPTPVPYGPSNVTARMQGMVGNLTIQSGRRIVILLGEDASGRLFIRPDPPQNPLQINESETVVFELRNVGNLAHNFKMGPPYESVSYTGFIQPGETVFFGPFDFVEPAREQYWCNVGGHRQSGMFADYIVGNPTGLAPRRVPTFEMMAITAAVGVPTMFAYVVHHARRRDD